MGRPSASPENRALGTCFASAVTKQSHSRLDFVARSGPLSLFSALGEMFAPCVRTENGKGFRDGVTEVQFNKELQKHGFKRVRDRRTQATKRSDDPTGAGMYLFSHLKWRNPLESEDREVLVEKYQNLVKRFPLVSVRCPLERFLALVLRYQSEWETSIERMQCGDFLEIEDEETDAVERVRDKIDLMEAAKALSSPTVIPAETRSLASSTLFQSQVPSSAPLNLNQEIMKMAVGKTLLQLPSTGPVLGVPLVGTPNLSAPLALQNQLAANLLAASLSKMTTSIASSDQVDLQKALLNPLALNAMALQQAIAAQEAMAVAGALNPLATLAAAQPQPQPQPKLDFGKVPPLGLY